MKTLSLRKTVTINLPGLTMMAYKPKTCHYSNIRMIVKSETVIIQSSINQFALEGKHEANLK